MRKIIVYGSKGWIGSQFIKILQDFNKNFICLNTRIENTEDVKRDIEEHNPTHIISFTGRTHGYIDGVNYSNIDYLEQPGKLKENIRDNLLGPLLLSNICKKYKIHYTYLGTGCIFKYDENHPYEKEVCGFKESDLPNFYGSSYSIVKAATDQLIGLIENNPTTLNLRIRLPITNTDNPRNLITKLTTYNRICSVKNSISVLPELLPIILNMMENQYVGTMNLTNPGLISHEEILNMYKKYVDPNFTWKKFSIEEQRRILETDRSNNYLDTSRLESLYPNIKNVKDSVEYCLKNYVKKNN